MPVKTFELPDIGTVNVYKRRGCKNIRLSIGHEGRVRVTVPAWSSYNTGLKFALQKREWVAKNINGLKSLLVNNQRIGKHHALEFVPRPGQALRTLVNRTNVFVYYDDSKLPSEQSIQQAAYNAAKRALYSQAQELLPQRVEQLATKHDYQYKALKIRHLKSRWGSCSSRSEITLNYYLMQLPWELIDYVLLHELAHTKQLNHSTKFWAEVTACMPDYRTKRQKLKSYQPSVLNFDNRDKDPA